MFANFKKTIALMLSILLAVSLSGISPVQAAQGTQAPAKIVDIKAGLGYQWLC